MQIFLSTRTCTVQTWWPFPPELCRGWDGLQGRQLWSGAQRLLCKDSSRDLALPSREQVPSDTQQLKLRLPEHVGPPLPCKCSQASSAQHCIFLDQAEAEQENPNDSLLRKECPGTRPTDVNRPRSGPLGSVSPHSPVPAWYLPATSVATGL